MSLTPRLASGWGPLRYLRLAALWLGVQCVWSAVLAVSLQARSVALVPHGGGLRAYALVAGVGAAIGMVTQLAIGPLADSYFALHHHRRRFYLLGALVSSVAIAWLYFAPTFALLTAAVGLLQIGMNVAMGPYAAIIPDYVDAAQIGRATSWLATVGSIGSVTGLLVAGFVPSLHLIAAILVLGLAFTCIISTEVTTGLRALPSRPQSLHIGRDIRTLLASRTAINTGFYTLLGFLFFYVVQSLHVAPEAARVQTALIFCAFTLANVAGALMGARPVDRFDKRHVVLVANVFIVLGLIGLAFASTFPIAIAMAAIAGVAWGTYFIADWALACTMFSRGAMAVSMSLWNVAATIPQIVAPALTTPLVERFNAGAPGAGPRAAIVLSCVEFTIGAVWLWRLPKRSTNQSSVSA